MKIRGVNRHEHHPRLGKTNLESCMVQVMNLMSVYVCLHVRRSGAMLVDMLLFVVFI